MLQSLRAVITGMLCLVAFQVFAQKDANSVNDQIVAALPAQVEIIGLGDPSHQESTITNLRIDLIKKLVREKGFRIIAIEGNLFGLHKAHEHFLEDADVVHYERAMYSQLNSTEMEELYQFVYEENQKGNPVKIVGFDTSFSGETYVREMEKELRRSNILSAEDKKDFVKALKKANIKNLWALFRNDRKVKSKIVNYAQKLLKEFDPVSREDLFFAQALQNLLFRFGTGQETRDRDKIRDIGMASNIAFLQKIFPQEKMLLFGSSTHLLKQPAAIKTTFFQNSRTTLGEQLSKDGNYYFIAYTALSGNRSNLFNKPKILEEPIEGSVERDIKDATGKTANFITKENYPVKEVLKTRFLGHNFLPVKLWRAMDGLVLVENVKPFEIKD